MTRWPVEPLTFSKKNPSRAIPRSTYIHPPSLAKIGQRTSEEIGNKQTDRQTDKQTNAARFIVWCIIQFICLFIYLCVCLLLGSYNGRTLKEEFCPEESDREPKYRLGIQLPVKWCTIYRKKVFQSFDLRTQFVTIPLGLEAETEEKKKVVFQLPASNVLNVYKAAHSEFWFGTGHAYPIASSQDELSRQLVELAIWEYNETMREQRGKVERGSERASERERERERKRCYNSLQTGNRAI